MMARLARLRSRDREMPGPLALCPVKAARWLYFIIAHHTLIKHGFIFSLFSLPLSHSTSSLFHPSIPFFPHPLTHSLSLFLSFSLSLSFSPFPLSLSLSLHLTKIVEH
ncbi:MAG: hypothetical protein BYD32DRAFT_427995 [Podila humilis]|nr:MAG: hypothetical protein BYD32DRAFT_427995 [Podila humilis]